jgi:hypothetical protein
MFAPIRLFQVVPHEPPEANSVNGQAEIIHRHLDRLSDLRADDRQSMPAPMGRRFAAHLSSL